MMTEGAIKTIRAIGRCGFAEHDEEGAVECQKSGLRLTVRDPLGHLVSIIRCRLHSDWIEAYEEKDYEQRLGV